jgi:hypothetical protein
MEKIKAPGFVKTLIDHNRGKFISVVVSGLTLIPMACSVKTVSPLSDKYVTKDQLDAEITLAVNQLNRDMAALQGRVEDLKVKANPAYNDLARKQQAINSAITVVDQLIRSQIPLPLQGVYGLLSATAITGLLVDNSRKDRQITKLEGTKP